MTNRNPSPTRQQPTERVIARRRDRYNELLRRAAAHRTAGQQMFPFGRGANDR